MIDRALHKQKIGQAQDGSKETPPSAIARPSTIGDTAIDDCQLSAGSFGFEKQVRPDLGLKHDEQRRANRLQSSAHGRRVIQGRIENGLDQLGYLAFGRVPAGDCRCGNIDRYLRKIGPDGPDQRNGAGDFADRDSMQPDAAGLRPSETLGQKSQTLSEMGAVIAVSGEPRGEVEEDER